MTQNYLRETRPDGTEFIRFTPVPPYETEPCVRAVCENYRRIAEDSSVDSLLVIPVFLHDFLCIHPFDDGNGRMSRLLTLLILYRSGYIVGKYISLEKLIADHKESYYEALQDSDAGWHEEENDYLPFARYMLGVIIAAYREFSDRVEVLITKGLSKPDRVKEIIRNSSRKMTKAEIMAQCPDVSPRTVQRALESFLASGEVLKIGGGRYTSYIWNREVDEK